MAPGTSGTPVGDTVGSYVEPAPRGAAEGDSVGLYVEPGKGNPSGKGECCFALQLAKGGLSPEAVSVCRVGEGAGGRLKHHICKLKSVSPNKKNLGRGGASNAGVHRFRVEAPWERRSAAARALALE